ncbi:MAG: hypothetical protein JSU86_18935, partial [Phycisphaerales bacterium]
MKALQTLVRTRRTAATAALVVVMLLTVSVVVPLRAAAQRASDTMAIAAGPRAETDQDARSTAQAPVVSEDSGSVATPIGTSYSVHHMVGADIDGDGGIDCRMINEIPPPDAPDDIVVYDGLPEAIMTDIFGTVPTVTESKIDYGAGSHRLVIDTSSPTGTDLFPEGITDPGTGTPLTDACFVIGIIDALDWPGQGTVTSAAIIFRSGDDVVAGPFDVTGPSYFNDPWTGVFGMTVEGGAGLGIDRVHLEILNEKTSQEPLAACCLNGQCLDTEQISCDFQGGMWQADASCGADPALPAPICDQPTCQFNNGLPLDDGGAPISQFAPDGPFGVGAADDFILRAPPGNPCRINLLRAWVTHSVAGVEPGTDYQGVNVTVYADAEPKGPAGRPEDDGSHTPESFRGIVYTQMIPQQAITATPLGASCTLDQWELDIPVDILLQKNTKYWLEVQPVMDSSVGQVLWLLSENNNDHPAQQIAREFGITDWEVIPGNTNACPDATPRAGTRTNLAFRLFGEEIPGPPNNDCADAIPVGDGIMSFSTIGATTDGDDEPEICEYSEYTHIESDIWFDYVAPCSGDVTVSLCGSEYDTKMAVYHGCDYCLPRTYPIACNEDYCATQSEVTHPGIEDDCYKIRVGGWLGTQGNGIMTIECRVPPPPTGACCDQWGDCIGTISEADCDAENGTWFEGQDCNTFTCPVPPPPHDECPACIPVVSGVPYNGSTRGASGSDTSSCSVNDTKDVWHCWTPDCNGIAIIGLCDSAFDTTLVVYDSCGGDELACSDDRCESQSLISPHQIPSLDVPVTAGETYYIRVSGARFDSGSYTLLVDDCANACCSEDKEICMLKTHDDCVSVPAIPQGDGTVCLGDSDHNGIDDICEQQPDTWFWKDFNGEEAGGYLPDFDQNKDYDDADGDGDPTTGVDPFYCGPTAVANSLWWFQDKYPDLSIVPLDYTKLGLIERLAELMGTNGTPGHPSPNEHPGPYAGTFVDDMQSGVDAYLAENDLAGLFYEHTATQPSYDLVVDELTRDQDVTLLLGFYHVESVDPVPDGHVVHWRRTGGHYVTIAGVDSVNGQIAISDPDADAAEESGRDFVRGEGHDHDADPVTTVPFRDPAYDHTVHNDKGLASHDVYDAMPSFNPGGSWILVVDGNPLTYGDSLAELHEGDAGGMFDATPTFVSFEFLDQHGYPPPVPCQTYTVVEHAVIVSPFEVCPEATIVDAAPPGGVVDARQPNTPSASLPRQGIGSQNEPIIITLDPAVEGAEQCFMICETAADTLLGSNAVA